MKKNKVFYRVMVFAGLILWLAETAYFGFNQTPENGLEGALDILSLLLIGWGLLGDFTTNLRITKSEHHIFNTKKFNYVDQRKNGKIVVDTREGGRRDK